MSYIYIYDISRLRVKGNADGYQKVTNVPESVKEVWTVRSEQ